ncbi:MAG: hypothetical protein ABIC04_05530 [Nanoarchaeota archaeon]
MNKKAISPLVSTLILIICAASLGVVVISWGHSEVINPEISECSKTGLSMIELGGIRQICANNDNVEFMIKNNGETNLDGIKFVIISDQGIESGEINRMILSSDVISEKVGSANRNIKKIMLVPKIFSGDNTKYCPKNGVDLEDIQPCEQ